MNLPSKTPTTDQPAEVEQSSAEPSETSIANPDDIKADPNPLNPAGDLDRLIGMRMNEDLWKSMLGDLPCLEANDACITKLQGLAVQNSRELKAIDQRIEAINQKINEAKSNNQKSIQLSVFEPLVQSWLTLETLPTQPGQPTRRKGLLDRIGGLFFGNTLDSINEIFSLIGVPLFRNASGGDSAVR